MARAYAKKPIARFVTAVTADQLVHLLNEYLGEMPDTLFRNLGTLDNYIGDAIMAFWGSPYP